MFRYRGISNQKVFWHYTSWRTPTRLAGVLQVGFTPPAPKKGRRPPWLGTAPSTSLFKQPHAMMLQVKERRNRRPSGNNREADLPLMPNVIVLTPGAITHRTGTCRRYGRAANNEDYRLHFADPPRRRRSLTILAETCSIAKIRNVWRRTATEWLTSDTLSRPFPSPQVSRSVKDL